MLRRQLGSNGLQVSAIGDAFNGSDISMIILQLAKIGHSEERLQTFGEN